MRRPDVEVNNAQGNHRNSRRLRTRSDDQIRRGSDLPDRRLCLRQRRPRCRPVQSRGGRLPLQPDRQSNHRGARSARHRARRRRRSARGRNWPIGAAFRADQPGRRRRQHRHRSAIVWNDAYLALAHPAAPGHHRPLCRQRSARRDRATDRRKHQGRVLRNHRQSRRQCLRYRSFCRHRAPPRRPACGRQHRRHPDPAQALRLRRRHCDPFADQVPRRPRHHARRRHRGQRPLSMDGACGPFSCLQRTRSVLSRHGLHKAIRPQRLYPAGAQRLSAHHGIRAVAVQCLSAAAGHRDGGTAGRTACRERPQSRGIPPRRPARRLGQLCRLCRQSLLRAGPEIPRRPRVIAVHVRHQGRPRSRQDLL